MTAWYDLCTPCSTRTAALTLLSAERHYYYCLCAVNQLTLFGRPYMPVAHQSPPCQPCMPGGCAAMLAAGGVLDQCVSLVE